MSATDDLFNNRNNKVSDKKKNNYDEKNEKHNSILDGIEANDTNFKYKTFYLSTKHIKSLKNLSAQKGLSASKLLNIILDKVFVE